MKYLVVKVPPAVDREGVGYCVKYRISGPKALKDCEPLSEVFFHSQKIGVVFPVEGSSTVRWMGGVPCEFLEEELHPETEVTGLSSPEPCEGPHEVMVWNL
jgi:hypothetical protein